jgi:glycosyltransferase involved in cell wall biosynthesis
MLRAARVLTCFGTQLYLDRSSGELRHGEAGAVPANVVLQPDALVGSSSRVARLVYDADGRQGDIDCRSDRCTAVGADSGSVAGGPADGGRAIVLDVVALERGLFALAARGRFLMAEPGGRVALCATVCRTWELLLASEPWCGAAVSLDTGRGAVPACLDVDWAVVQSYVVHPMIRMRSGIGAGLNRVLIFGYSRWSHGRVYYDLCRHLHARGLVVDLLDWQGKHSQYMAQLASYYDLFMVALDGVSVLADVYRIPPERMIALSHSQFDVRMLIEQKATEIFERFAAYGAVSESVYCASLTQGVPRAPIVASLGVNYAEFHADIAEELRTVGYATSLATTAFGVEWKRGRLAAQAAEEAGLPFVVAGSTADQISFHDMPAFYRSVDAIVMSSLTEASPLPVLEGAAAGRLVIGTPVGNFPQKAYGGGGILAPVEDNKFVAFCADTLRRYRHDRIAYRDKCRDIQEAARLYDWPHHIGGWVDLVTSARGRG